MNKILVIILITFSAVSFSSSIYAFDLGDLSFGVDSVIIDLLQEPESKYESSLSNENEEVTDDSGKITPNEVEKNDSLVGSTYNLDEIVVETDKEVRLKNGMAYYPNKNIKNNSADGINLLARMMIPTLRVNLLDNSVNTVSGSSVSYFINGMKSNVEEVMTLDPKDVNRVEVLEYPTEAKYMGAEMVVNYVVTRYLWGGYTKVSATGSAPCPFINGNIQSGFTYKHMTYKAYVSSSYLTMDQSSSTTEHLLINNIPYTIESSDKVKKGHN